MEKGVVRNAKGCAACSVGAACLADGPIPDFEVAGLLGLYGIF
ncbi:MAG: subtilosin A family bacteriocin [Clostridium sp.]